VQVGSRYYAAFSGLLSLLSESIGMDRIARLTKISSALRRRIWASLPFSLRIADFFSRIALSSAEVFGKAIYGEFLMHGITEGMPDIHGQPASEFDISKKPVANRLPANYGKAFGQKAYQILLGKLHNPQVVEDVMSDFLVRFLASGSDNLDMGSTRARGESYVLTGLINESYNYIRKIKIKREVSDVLPDDAGGQFSHIRNFPVYDEESLEKLVKKRMPQLAPLLNRVHPEASKYVELSLIEGYSDREIIGDVAHGKASLLDNPYTPYGKPLTSTNWGLVYKPKIFEVLKESFADLQ